MCTGVIDEDVLLSRVAIDMIPAVRRLIEDAKEMTNTDYMSRSQKMFRPNCKKKMRTRDKTTKRSRNP